MAENQMGQTPTMPNGYYSRPATWDDLDAFVQLCNLDAKEKLGVEDTTVEEIRNDWESEEFSLEKDSQLVFSDEGELTAMVEVFNFQNPPVRPYVWMRILPGLTDSAIGDFALQWGEARARKMAAEIPENARLAMQMHNVSGYQPLKKLFERHAMQLIRHSFQMRIDMDSEPEAPIWPEGISLHTFEETKDLEAIYRANEEAFRDHFGAIEESFEEGFPRFEHYMLNDEGHDPSLWFIVKEGDEIAGVSLCRKHSWEEKDMGWVRDLSVRRPWRKRGLGLALLLHSFGEYYRRGFRRVGLGVDASNLTGALRLYEKAGMYIHRQYDRYEKELRTGIELARTALED